MLLLAAVLAATHMNAPPSQSAATRPHCTHATSYYAWQRGKRVKPQALTELPDANLYLPVYRRVDGCEVPIIVKYGVSGR